MIAGKGPDIIDMGFNRDALTTLLPYQRMARGGYLEDLWPYIENDPELGRDALLEPPLKAAEVEGGLYIAFPSVMINTLKHSLITPPSGRLQSRRPGYRLPLSQGTAS